jgi:hypothetical protein
VAPFIRLAIDWITFPCRSLVSHQGSEVRGERQRPRDRRSAEIVTVQAVEGDAGDAPHVDRRRPGETFGPEVGHRVVQSDVALLVGHHEWACRDPVEGRQHHLGLREGPAHAIRIDDGDAATRSEAQRDDRVETSCLDGHRERDVVPEVGHDRFEGSIHFLTFRKLLVEHGGRAHDRRRDSVLSRRDVLDLHQLDRPVCTDRLAGDELADIRAPATSGPQDGGADGDVVKDILGDVRQHAFSLRARSPTTLSRMRMASSPT